MLTWPLTSLADLRRVVTVQDCRLCTSPTGGDPVEERHNTDVASSCTRPSLTRFLVVEWYCSLAMCWAKHGRAGDRLTVGPISQLTFKSSLTSAS